MSIIDQRDKELSKTYKSEDRGLWDEKSDKALQKLESKANSPGSG